jgi:hypothetical protein
MHIYKDKLGNGIEINDTIIVRDTLATVLALDSLTASSVAGYRKWDMREMALLRCEDLDGNQVNCYPHDCISICAVARGARASGHAEGYDDGYERGYDAGHEAGFELAHNEVVVE